MHIIIIIIIIIIGCQLEILIAVFGELATKALQVTTKIIFQYTFLP
jgi:hypothetical protein